MWNYKKQKEELRNRLVEQLKLNAPSSIKPIVSKPVGLKPTTTISPLPPGAERAMMGDIGPTIGDWGEDEDGNPDLTTYRIPAFGTDSGPQVTPFNPYEIDIPEEPDYGDEQARVVERPPGSGNWFYRLPGSSGWLWPIIEVPKGSGHYEVDMSGGPWLADGERVPNTQWEIIDGNFYGFNPNCMCWTQMIYDPTTNRWTWGSPGHIVCADCDFPDNPVNNSMYDIGEDGHWYQVYPVSVGDGLEPIPGPADAEWWYDETYWEPGNGWIVPYPFNMHDHNIPEFMPTCTQSPGCYLYDPMNGEWWYTGYNGSGYDWEVIDGPPWDPGDMP